jgi:regulator of nonsense transcripts 1
VEKLLTRFLQSGVLPNQLGVITPYEGQRAHVVATLLRHGEDDMRQHTQYAVAHVCSATDSRGVFAMGYTTN